MHIAKRIPPATGIAAGAPSGWEHGIIVVVDGGTLFTPYLYFAMETSSSSSDFQERRVGPTVSKDKWINHARLKLSKGYVLIVGKQKKTANFWLRSKGFEMCPHNVARQLVKEGVVVEAGEHALGTIYKLAEELPPPPAPKRRPAPEPDPVKVVLAVALDDVDDEDDIESEDDLGDGDEEAAEDEDDDELM